MNEEFQNNGSYYSVQTFFRKKEIKQEEILSTNSLRRTLSAVGLISLGIGAIIGAGIFVLTGQAAARYAGPAITLSFVLSGVGCLFTALCYAEFAAMIPASGSAYTYAYATLGEFPAWIIGWDLILEYMFAGPTVAVGWSGHFVEFLAEFGLHFPHVLSSAPFDVIDGSLVMTHSVLNLPAFLIVWVITAVLVVGIRESGIFNDIMVLLKLSVVLAIIIFGFGWIFFHWTAACENWTPFIPPNTGTFGEFGLSGVVKGAAVIFFSFIGFDAVSTAAQEARDPQRDMPIGILSSLLICTTFFVLFSLALTGMLSYTSLDGPAPVIDALQSAGAPFLLRLLVEIAALAGLSSVVLVMLMGQPRIFFSMSLDGLLPPVFARIHPRFKTPYVSQLMMGCFASVIAALLPLSLLGELVSIGTLLAFFAVAISVIVLRRTRPDLHRPFRTPFVPVVPLLGALVCLLQMISLPWETWLRLIIWLLIGLLIYFFYGVKHSRLNFPDNDHLSESREELEQLHEDEELPIEYYTPSTESSNIDKETSLLEESLEDSIKDNSVLLKHSEKV